MVMILLIDNYDSFTYNLVQRFGELGESPVVYRNDAVTIPAIERLKLDRIVISPGPCTPREAGVSNAVISHFAGRIAILGVCLGHQCIGAVFGGEVVRAARLMHGKTSRIHHDGRGVYRGLPNPFTATRYHSLVVREDSLPHCLVATAHSETGELMGLRHREFAVEGVQFHPESFLTESGTELLRNFLSSEFGPRRERPRRPAAAAAEQKRGARGRAAGPRAKSRSR
jgi:anthranilate synthase/aminodeoxychorismate synthase-like glutamine amidotransferase